MSNSVIRVENLGKQYHIGGQQEQYRTLRDNLVDAVTGPLRRICNPGSTTRNMETIWALRDISFGVKRGEVVGIIGRNGAGKSTLLKILSRITEPTRGRIEICGQVSSLLEVGTGFHPELTGRENIYLNGAILGMGRAEIKRKFDEIVAFSEIERFIDTPVKRYSSGMYVRLAFAVAAHLEPEILLVDEVLAVGDYMFRKKCLGKMKEVSGQGRTVLYVSHNMPSLINLCSRAILLNEGKIVKDDSAKEVVGRYLSIGQESSSERLWSDLKSAPGNDHARLRAVRVVSEDKVASDVAIDKDIQIEIEFWNLVEGAHLSTSIHLLDDHNNTVLASSNMTSASLSRDKWYGRPHPNGLFQSICTLPGNFLNEGTYYINAIVLSDVDKVEVWVNEAVSFTVVDTGGMRKEYSGHWRGVVRPKLAWHTSYLESSDSEATIGEHYSLTKDD